MEELVILLEDFYDSPEKALKEVRRSHNSEGVENLMREFAKKESEKDSQTDIRFYPIVPQGMLNIPVSIPNSTQMER